MKSAIRKEMISKRRAMTQDEMMEKSSVIQTRVLGLSAYKESEVIGLYASFNNEVSTSVFFDRAVKDGKKVLFPRIKAEEKELEFVAVRRLEELELGAYGILSPPHGEGHADSIRDRWFLVIPGVAYDLKGGRLGYGGGFYDRYLHKLERKPFIAALAYEFQILDDIPMRPHDVRVDAIITEQRVIICKGK